MGFVNRYVILAGRNCCPGRSWASLDRSLARHACETPPEAREGTRLDTSANGEDDKIPVAAENARA
jgi:hypothetical protein